MQFTSTLQDEKEMENSKLKKTAEFFNPCPRSNSETRFHKVKPESHHKQKPLVNMKFLKMICPDFLNESSYLRGGSCFNGADRDDLSIMKRSNKMTPIDNRLKRWTPTASSNVQRNLMQHFGSRTPKVETLRPSRSEIEIHRKDKRGSSMQNQGSKRTKRVFLKGKRRFPYLPSIDHDNRAKVHSSKSNHYPHSSPGKEKKDSYKRQMISLKKASKANIFNFHLNSHSKFDGKFTLFPDKGESKSELLIQKEVQSVKNITRVSKRSQSKEPGMRSKEERMKFLKQIGKFNFDIKRKFNTIKRKNKKKFPHFFLHIDQENSEALSKEDTSSSNKAKPMTKEKHRLLMSNLKQERIVSESEMEDRGTINTLDPLSIHEFSLPYKKLSKEKNRLMKISMKNIKNMIHDRKHLEKSLNVRSRLKGKRKKFSLPRKVKVKVVKEVPENLPFLPKNDI